MGKIALLLSLVCLPMVLGGLCPDQTSRCPSTSTCCKTGGGGYGCCPYVDATCCSDGSHCCPSHLDCDLEHSRCVPKYQIPYPFSSLEPWNEIGETNFITVDTEIKQQTCPDGRQKCPDSYTCCAMIGGGFGCCPKEHGVCCADGVHCCPRDTKCNLDTRGCDRL